MAAAEVHDDKRLPLLARRDLVVRRHWYESRLWYAIQEPLSLNCFRLREEEYFLLGLLDGRATVSRMQAEFARRFSPQTISNDEIQRLLKTLLEGNLVFVDARGQGGLLHRKRGEAFRKKILSTLANVLWLRFRGIDPDRLLTSRLPWCRWIFTPVAAGVALLLALTALLWIGVQYPAFAARLPDYQSDFTPQTVLYLLAVLGVTKLLHELGHGLACKRFGGECHELGVMLLVFTPTLYCDVRSSTMFDNKWHRIVVSGAGMYVELALASLAVFGWWFSQPGLFHQLCLATMLVCSVTTVAFNANPLLRYDGYYILSDYLEIPNLAQQASQALQATLGRTLLGIEPAVDPFSPRRRWLLSLYAVAAACYRWLVTFSILWFLCQFFEPYRLKVVGQSLAVGALGMMAGVPLWRLLRFFWTPGRTDLVDRRRFRLALVCLALLLLAVWLVPLPHSVLGTVEIEPLDAAPVYVEVPGTLDQVTVQSGQPIEAGQLLARLEDDDLQLAVERLTAERQKLEVQIANLRRQRFDEPDLATQLTGLSSSLAAVERQLLRKQADAARLELRAPVEGVVIPPPEAPERRGPDGRALAWSGSPLAAYNQGCFLEPGTLLCHVGRPDQLKAHLVIDQQDVDLVAAGQTVDVKLDGLPLASVRSTIAHIGQLDLKISPRQLTNKSGGELATRTDPSGIERPMNVSYEAEAPLTGMAAQGLRPGLRGVAKIRTPWQSLGARGWRWMRHTFHFRL